VRLTTFSHRCRSTRARREAAFGVESISQPAGRALQQILSSFQGSRRCSTTSHIVTMSNLSRDAPPSGHERLRKLSAAGLASMLSCIGVRFDTHGSDAVVTRDPAQTATAAAEISSLLPASAPIQLRLVKCLSQYCSGYFGSSDTLIRAGIVELLEAAPSAKSSS